MREGCFLCGRISGGIPFDELCVGTGRLTRVVVAPAPFNSGEVMIAPRRHVASLDALTDEELEEIGEWMVRIEEAMARTYHPQGITMGGSSEARLNGGEGDHMAIRVTRGLHHRSVAIGVDA